MADEIRIERVFPMLGLFTFIGIILYSISNLVVSYRWEFIQKPRLATTESGVIVESICRKTEGLKYNYYYFDFQYSYEVDGGAFSSRLVSYYSTGNCFMVQKYKVGQPVKVYYDPLNPALAVVDPGLENNSLKSLIVNNLFNFTFLFGSL